MVQRTQMVHSYLDFDYKCSLSGVCLGSCNISSICELEEELACNLSSFADDSKLW